MTERFTVGWEQSEPRKKGQRMGTLWTTQQVDGEVTLSVAFDALAPIARLDLLQDFMGLLKREYDIQLAAFIEPPPMVDDDDENFSLIEPQEDE